MASPTPEVDLATHYDTQSVGTLGANVFHGPVQPYKSGAIPHKAIFCVPYGGPPPEPIFGQSEDFRRMHVQVRIRSDVGDYSGGRALANTVWDNTQRASITGYIACYVVGSVPVYLGTDDQEHHEWSINAELWWAG